MPRTNSVNDVLRRVQITNPGGCWIWGGELNSKGYGRVSFGARTWLAHRLLYEQLDGPVPAGFVLDHLCRERACVNPLHLEPVTERENWLRGASPTAVRALSATCAHGHHWDAANTYRNPKTGRRQCRACNHEGYLRRAGTGS